MKTDINFRSYLSQFFLQWESFPTKFVKKIKTHILCWITFFFSKIVPFMRCVEKYCWAGQAIVDTVIGRIHIACWVPKATEPTLSIRRLKKKTDADKTPLTSCPYLGIARRLVPTRKGES